MLAWVFLRACVKIFTCRLFSRASSYYAHTLLPAAVTERLQTHKQPENLSQPCTLLRLKALRTGATFSSRPSCPVMTDRLCTNVVPICLEWMHIPPPPTGTTRALSCWLICRTTTTRILLIKWSH
jgi:hypothetical protein